MGNLMFQALEKGGVYLMIRLEPLSSVFMLLSPRDYTIIPYDSILLPAHECGKLAFFP